MENMIEIYALRVMKTALQKDVNEKGIERMDQNLLIAALAILQIRGLSDIDRIKVADMYARVIGSSLYYRVIDDVIGGFLPLAFTKPENTKGMFEACGLDKETYNKFQNDAAKAHESGSDSDFIKKLASLDYDIAYKVVLVVLSAKWYARQGL